MQIPSEISFTMMPYKTSVRATVEATQNLGPPIPKVDPKTLYDNSLLKGLETEGFVDKIKAR